MKYFVSLFVVLSLSVLTGCTKSDGNVFVTGEVTYKGELLADASVVFTAVDGAGEDASGKTNENGTFDLTTVTGKSGSGTKPGEYKVSITKKNVEWDGVSFLPRPPGQEPVKDVKVSDFLPREYSTYSTTPLKATVTKKKEDNVFKFEIP